LAHIGDYGKPQLCTQNCGQTAADKDMVTIENLYSPSLAAQQNIFKK